MIIRKTNLSDVDRAAEIYDNARCFMRKTGNLLQWNDGYPNADTVREDIKSGKSYVLEDEGRVIAVFYFAIEEDETYKTI